MFGVLVVVNGCGCYLYLFVGALGRKSRSVITEGDTFLNHTTVKGDTMDDAQRLAEAMGCTGDEENVPFDPNFWENVDESL